MKLYYLMTLLLLFISISNSTCTFSVSNENDDSTGTAGSDDTTLPSLSSYKSISRFAVGSNVATIDDSKKTIILEVSDSNISALTPTFYTYKNATVKPASGVAQDFTKPVIYTVTAEDGSTTKYTVTVVVKIIPLSNVKTMESFKIGLYKGVINESTKTILLTTADSNVTSLVPTITVSDKSTIVPASGIAQNFTKPVTYKITAEDGTIETYTVTVVIDDVVLSDTKSIMSFSIGGIQGIINDTTKNIVLQLEDDFLKLLIPKITVSENATISPASGVGKNFTNPVIYTVTAEDGTQTEYIVSVFDSSKVIDDAKITKFTIGGIAGIIDDKSKTITLETTALNIDSLVPIIEISEYATIELDSGTAQNFTEPVTYTLTALDGSVSTYTVHVTSTTLVTFSYNGTNYEIVKLNKNWLNAAAFAVERGGYLAEINSVEEQNEIYSQLQSASITTSSTTAPDGGGAAYVWIGGNDLSSEGRWVWDGDYDQVNEQFWQGTKSGSPVGGLYNNWGNEPDNYGSGQDALGLALTRWPYGSAGQWNDVSHTNSLYFVIELD